MRRWLIMLFLLLAAMTHAAPTIGTVQSVSEAVRYNDLYKQYYRPGEQVETVTAGVPRTTYRTSVGLPMLPLRADDIALPAFEDGGYLYSFRGTTIYKMDNFGNRTTDTALATTAITDIGGGDPANGSVYFAEVSATPSIQFLGKTKSGNWIAVIGAVTATTDGSSPCGFIIVKDATAGTWSIKVRLIEGSAFQLGIWDDVCLVGTYATEHAQSTAYGVPIFASDDEGETWALIWSETEKITTALTKHTHYFNRIDTNNFWIAFGDGANAVVRHLVKPSGWSITGDRNATFGYYDDAANLWTASTSINSTGAVRQQLMVGPTSVQESGKVFYTAHTGSAFASCVNWVDTTTYRLGMQMQSMYRPMATEDAYVEDLAAWRQGTTSSDAYSMQKVDGVYRFMKLKYSIGDGDDGTVGLYVAKNPFDWFAAAIREPHRYTAGIGYREESQYPPAVYFKDRFIASRGSLNMAAFAKPSAERKLAYLITSGGKNVVNGGLGVVPSTTWQDPDTPTNVWNSSAKTVQILYDPGSKSLYSVEAGQGLFGTHALCVTPKATVTNSDPFTFRFILLASGLTTRTTEKIYTFSAWVRAEMPADRFAYVTVRSANGNYMYSRYNDNNSYPSRQNVGHDWTRIYGEIKCVTTNTDYIYVSFVMSEQDDYTLEQLQQCHFYIDGFQLYENESSQIRTLSTPLTTSTDAAPDYCTASLSGLNTSWSASFDWWPGEASDDVRYTEGDPTYLPISTWKNDDAYLTLGWNRNTKKFELYDGADTTTLTPDVPLYWQHYDCIKFSVVNTASGTAFFVYAPTNFYCSKYATAWHPAWSNDSVDYVVGNIVQNDGLPYVCIANNTSEAGNEPGTEGGAEEWALIDDDLILKATGSAKIATAPTTWVLGADNAGTTVGCGAIGNLSISDNLLTDETVRDAMRHAIGATTGTGAGEAVLMGGRLFN